MALAVRGGTGRVGYGKRRADLEPLACMLADVPTLADVPRLRSRESGRPGFSKEERP